MTRPKTLKAAKRRTWQAISEYIRRKHSRNGIVTCVTCGSTARWNEGGIHTGHFIHGLTYAQDDDGEFYFLESNLKPQCAGCNTFNAGRLDVYCLHMIDTHGRDHVEWLQSLRHKPLKMRIDDFFRIEQEVRQQIEELE